MQTKLLIFVAGSFLLLFTGLVSGNQRNNLPPHRCDADDESSSEECYNYNRQRQNPGALRAEASKVTVRFYLHKNGAKESKEIFANSVESVRAANPFPPSEKTDWKILIPGFPMNGKSPFPENVIQAYKQRAENVPLERYNVLVVDWSPAACLKDIDFKNTTYTAIVGQRLAELLLLLEEHHYLILRRDTHIIGFSLGAHVAGEAARFVFRKFAKRNLIFRVTALDPAGEKFWPWRIGRSTLPIEKVSRIRRSFIGFLDVIHTSSVFGTPNKLGDIDFYPNGGDSQPGCRVNLFPIIANIEFRHLCSHVFATELFARSINDKSMKGCTGYDYYDLWKVNKNKCEDRPVLGEYVDEEQIEGFPLAVGVAYLETSDLNEFGKRFKQHVENKPNPVSLIVPPPWYHLCD